MYTFKIVVNCKSASILRYVDNDPEIETPELVTTVKAGKTISVDLEDVAYSWDDKKYYKCKVGGREGYILAGLIM